MAFENLKEWREHKKLLERAIARAEENVKWWEDSYKRHEAKKPQKGKRA